MVPDRRGRAAAGSELAASPCRGLSEGGQGAPESPVREPFGPRCLGLLRPFIPRATPPAPRL